MIFSQKYKEKSYDNVEVQKKGNENYINDEII